MVTSVKPENRQTSTYDRAVQYLEDADKLEADYKRYEVAKAVYTLAGMLFVTPIHSVLLILITYSLQEVMTVDTSVWVVLFLYISWSVFGSGMRLFLTLIEIANRHAEKELKRQ